jgi:hypothetical protein
LLDDTENDNQIVEGIIHVDDTEINNPIFEGIIHLYNTEENNQIVTDKNPTTLLSDEYNEIIALNHELQNVFLLILDGSNNSQ